jgi:hypothetical protein
MKATIINKKEAYRQAMILKDKAFAIAKSYNTLPGYCFEPECVKYCELISLTQLKDDEGAIFIDGKAAYMLTDFQLDNEKTFIGKICVKNAIYVEIIYSELIIIYNDGVKEFFYMMRILNAGNP